MPQELTTQPPRAPVTIQISRGEVEQGDCARVIQILNSFVPDLAERNRNRVDFEVMGYLDDPREIYDIPEVRGYFVALFTAHRGLFYWVNTHSHSFFLLGLLVLPPRRVPGGVTLAPADLQQYLFAGFSRLNEFCEEHGLDPEPSTLDISRVLGMV